LWGDEHLPASGDVIDKLTDLTVKPKFKDGSDGSGSFPILLAVNSPGTMGPATTGILLPTELIELIYTQAVQIRPNLYAGDSHKFMLANCSQMFLQCSCSCEPL
jgi:hypothetical protein